MCNSKFQGLEAARALKKRPNLDQKTLPKLNKHEKNQQKRRKEKRRQPSEIPSLFFFLSYSLVFISHHHLHKNKKNGKKTFATFGCSSSTPFEAGILHREKSLWNFAQIWIYTQLPLILHFPLFPLILTRSYFFRNSCFLLIILILIVIFLNNLETPLGNRQTWPRLVMKHTPRSGPGSICKIEYLCKFRINFSFTWPFLSINGRFLH